MCTAASSGDVETVHRLHIQGLNINCCDYDKRTALHISVASSHFDVVKYLVENGADVNPLDRWQLTPLNDAIDPEIHDYLTSHGAKRGKEEQVAFTPVPAIQITDDQDRLFWAAYFNHILFM